MSVDNQRPPDSKEDGRQPSTARALIRNEDGDYLLVKDSRPRWYLPGGRIQQDEPPTTACAREVYEEVGLIIAVGLPLVIAWQASTEPGRAARYSFTFDGGLRDPAQSLRLQEGEVDEACWASPDRALDMVTSEIAERLIAWHFRPAGQSLIYLQQIS